MEKISTFLKIDPLLSFFLEISLRFLKVLTYFYPLAFSSIVESAKLQERSIFGRNILKISNETYFTSKLLVSNCLNFKNILKLQK